MTPKKTLSLAGQALRRRREESERRIQAQLTPLVQGLTDPDESRRRAAVEHVLRACLPVVVGQLIDRLVDRLGRGGAARRNRVIASLVDFSSRALPALIERFRRGRGPAAQLDVLAALRRMTPRLTSYQLADLLLEVGVLGLFAAGGSVRRALKETIAQLQHDLRDLVKPAPRARYERVQEAGSPPGAAPDAAAGLPGLP
jgi:hypothetical protein